MSVLARRLGARPGLDPADVGVGTLFDEHAPMVLGICRYLLRDPQAAEDAAQETFLSAHRSLLRGTRPRDPAAWLATIARNQCRRTWKAAPTAPLDEGTVGTILDPADIVAERADLAEVTRAIAELPERQRQALVLREFWGLSYDQVAAAMRLSGSAVDSLLSRARRRLSERLGYIPRAARGALVVPASLREDLSRLIPGLDSAGSAAGVASGVGGAATLASLGSAPLVTKVAATGAAAVALALPVQGAMRVQENPQGRERPRAVAQPPKPEAERPAARSPVAPTAAGAAESAGRARSDNSGPGSGLSGSSGSGSGSSGSGSAGGGGQSSGGSSSGSSSSGSSGSGSSGSGEGASSSSDSGSSGSGDGGSRSDSDSSGSGSSDSGSGSGSSGSGSGSSGSGSGSSGSGSSGSGGGSDSGSSGSGSGSSESGSDVGGSGSGDSGSSGSSGSGSGGSGSEDPPDEG
jgi:RNA polymerase sigma factor (sigma-70 family)